MDFNLPQLEKKIIKFWRENRTFEKSLKQRDRARNFVFYEGPPTANGQPGIHHVLSRVFKDIVLRYKTMQGFRVLRKAGWDTHGLPVELEVEKELGLKSKKDIEKFGIARFNKLCQQSVWKYKEDWERLTERIGFWLDLEHPYITYQPRYIESVWWIIKQLYKKGLLYLGYRVLPYCPRCGTGLSSHEVAQGYKKVKEKAIYIKFKIVSDKKKWKSVSILSWTTTPWTLPGNVALAINPKFTYVKAKSKKGTVILAKERLSVLGKEYRVIEEVKGKDLVGLKYKPLFNVEPLKSKTSYKVYPAHFVTAEEGTGVVHTAVMYGEDDYNLGRKVGLPTCHTVTEEGKFTKDVKEGLAGLYVKDFKTEALIIESLRKKGLLFAEEMYEHDYPFCWRCSSPLLYFAKESWFINMQKVKKDLIRENQKIKWVPANLREGRFGEWLREIKDWALSRERYWATPLPIWQCQKCKHQEVIGGRKDLLEQKFTSNKHFILRHGESLRNIKKTVACWPEKKPTPLTEKGKTQIKTVAKKLKKEKVDVIFSSDLLRAKQTAQIIAEELGLRVNFDKRLRELDMGSLNGKSVEEAARFWDPEKKLKTIDYYLERFRVRAPGGESYFDAQKRMYKFLLAIDSKYKEKTILIVGHELPLTALEGAVKGLTPEEIVKYRLKSKIKVGELRNLEFKIWPYNEEGKLDFHRPYIDEVKFRCPQCQNLMERVPEVIDCWFDSGSMPFAQYHYPFEKKDLIDPSTGSGRAVQFPADYIAEAVDQTRGWFYTLHAISNLLGKGLAYRNVISLGHVLDEKGEKMSKSKGNVVAPASIIEKYGADTTRWYFFTINQPGDAKLFSEKDVAETLRRFILTFWNSFLFFKTYRAEGKPLKPKAKNILDKWVISKLNRLVQEVTNYLEDYNITSAARAIEKFLVEDLSQWYIRRSRKRFQKPEGKGELKEASDTLFFCLSKLAELTAPFVPFLAEIIYQQLGSKKSVHLAGWPKADKKLIDKKTETKMERIREIINLALRKRAEAAIKVRQPLAGLQIKNQELKKEKELLSLIQEEVNVKQVTFGKTLKLDTKVTTQLREEGIVREVVRNIQEMRKKAGLSPRDKIEVRYSGAKEINEILAKNKELILKEARIEEIFLGERPKQVFDVERELKISQLELWLAIKKV